MAFNTADKTDKLYIYTTGPIPGDLQAAFGVIYFPLASPDAQQPAQRAQKNIQYAFGIAALHCGAHYV